MKKILFIIILIILSVAVFASIVPNWYPVSQWELDFCSKWGGTEESQQGSQSSDAIYLSQLTIALQAKKLIYNVSSYQNTLYKASWYIEPVLGDYTYRVELVNDNGEIYKIGDGQASYSKPGYGYYADYHNTSYTHAIIGYGSSYLKVPIIEIQQLR